MEEMMGYQYDVTALGELLIDFTQNGNSEQGNLLFEALLSTLLELPPLAASCLPHVPDKKRNPCLRLQGYAQRQALYLHQGRTRRRFWQTVRRDR